MKPTPSELENDYPVRGPLHQFRFKEASAFHCFRCGTSKKAKLITIYNEDWNRRLCNGCYGRLLSIYNIKAGTGSDDEKATALAELLLSIFNKNQAIESERLFKLSENRGQNLSAKALRFVATSEHVSRALEGVSNLDWSSATIGLCKAFEFELIERIINPLANSTKSLKIDEDMKDKDIGRVAKYCKDTSAKPPELGVFAHFLQTIINSEKRRANSLLIKTFMEIAKSWTKSNWILDSAGLYDSLIRLTRDFRNRAAHIEELTKKDYDDCRDFIIGKSGILWQLLLATKNYKSR